MSITQISIQRFSVTSTKPFGDVVAAFREAVGHPDMNAFRKSVAATKTWTELEKVVGAAIGSSGLMEFAYFDLGEVLRRESGPGAPQCLRFVVGNPLIMKQMVEHVPDAGSYAPVTILIDERPDGTHLSYDRMVSYLAPYESLGALKVAEELDSKVEALLLAAAK